jgi:hypothetical protein
LFGLTLIGSGETGFGLVFLGITAVGIWLVIVTSKRQN